MRFKITPNKSYRIVRRSVEAVLNGGDKNPRSMAWRNPGRPTSPPSFRKPCEHRGMGEMLYGNNSHAWRAAHTLNARDSDYIYDVERTH